MPERPDSEPSGARAPGSRGRTAPSRSEGHYQALLGGVRDFAIVGLDGEGRVESWSAGAERLTGYAVGEALGRPISFLYPEEDRERGRPEAILQRAAEESSLREEGWCVRKDGSRFWADTVLILVPDETVQFTGFAVVVRDLTKRKQTEAQLRLLEAVVASANDAVVITDSEVRIEYVNPAYTRITGYTAGEVVGKTPGDFLHGPGTDHGTTARIRTALERQEAVREELLNYRKDGSPIWVEVSVVPVRDETGQLTHWASVQRETTERRRTVEELERLQHQQELILASAGEGVYGLDARGRTTFVNPAAAQMLGWDAEDLIGNVQHDIIHHSHPDGSPYPREECSIYTALRDGALHRVEDEVFWRKDGTSLPVEYTAAPIWEGGQVVGAVIVFQDISARKEAEETQRRFTAILEATPDCIWIADPEGQVLYLNRAGRDMAGIDAEYVEGLTISDLQPEWAASRILREAVPAAIRMGVWRGEAEVLRRDGHLIPVSQVVLAHRESEGRVAYLSAVARDISDRTRLEEVHRFMSEASRALSASLDYQATLRRITELAVPEQGDFCLIDLVGEQGEIRREAAVHRDAARQTLMGRLCRFPPDEDRRLGASRVLRTGKSELVAEVSDAWLRAVSRSETHHALLKELGPRSEMLVPLRVRNRVIGVITFGRVQPDRIYASEDLFLAEDFASRAALALDNAGLYRESQQAMRIRDEVLSIVAHDLRNPLNTIGMGVGLLLETASGEAEGSRKQLQIIGRSVERADELIQDLLDVARMEAGRLTMEPETVAPGPLLEEAIELHGALAQERDLRLTAEIPEELPEIQADRRRIQQVLQNLIGNAITFTPEGGQITVGAEPAAGEVRFMVSDTGPGIPREDLPHLFDAFWQAKKGAAEGAGLGLAIAKGIVAAHGGRIWVESKLGQGTTFHFSLPVAGAELREQSPTAEGDNRWRVSGRLSEGATE